MKQVRRGALALLSAAVWLGIHAWKVTAAATCGTPVQLHYQVLRQIHRSETGFTQGLIYRDHVLYESTGGYGSSGLNRIDPESGRVEALGKLPQDQFGEGLESDGKTFFQLTWNEHRLNQWGENGKLKRSATYPYEGWGLTRNSRGAWISSDGSNTLRFFDRAPEERGDASWTASFQLSVMNGARPETGLNELEFARGAVFANIFREPRIVRIDPASGCVTGELDMNELVVASGINLEQNPEFVLNGIAYRAETDTFFITGKNWPTIYEARFLSGDG